MYACEEPHKACTASLVQFVDAGVGEDLGEHLTDLILQDEIGQVFAEVLADAGVYKLDEAGRAGFVRFLASVQ